MKLDQIQGVLNRLCRNPDPKSAWKEANMYFGASRGSALPECTTNSDPKSTSTYQNEYFINKVEKLAKSLPEDISSESYKCATCNG